MTTSRPSASETRALAVAPPSAGQQDLERPAPAAGDRAEVRDPGSGALEATPDRRRDDGRAQRCAEGGGCDEDRPAVRHLREAVHDADHGWHPVRDGAPRVHDGLGDAPRPPSFAKQPGEPGARAAVEGEEGGCVNAIDAAPAYVTGVRA